MSMSGNGLQVFPHHENELAQSQAACCEPDPSSDQSRLARFWMHNGFVNINNEKMYSPLLLSPFNFSHYLILCQDTTCGIDDLRSHA